MKPKTFFGMPAIYLKVVVTIAGLMTFLKEAIPVQTTLTLGATLLIGGFIIFQAVKDKLILEILIYNLEMPKKIGF
jgi:hypothetical protein